jgi:dihydrofolate synthase/folylpolyglutamate synthase
LRVARPKCGAHGGRVVDLHTPGDEYPGLFVPLYGAHQADNAACATAAAEAFFGRPMDLDVVKDAFAGVRVPGRCEVMSRHPLIVLDGAHNPDGARALGRTLSEDFAARGPDTIVVGFTAGRDPVEMLAILGAARSRLVVACRPPHPRGLPADDVARAAAQLGVDAETAPSVEAAVERARQATGEDGFILVTGSLYLVGEVRAALH